MIRWLIQHNWKSIKRSPDFERKVIVNIIFGILVLFMTLQFLMLGYFLDRVIKEDLRPGSNPVEVVNSVLIFYFGMEFMMRLSFQKLRSAAGKQYLLLNISRQRIAHFVLIKTPGTMINFFPLLIIIPFFFKAVLAAYSTIASIAWLVLLLAILFFNTFLANYLKLRFYKNPIITSTAVGSIITVILLEKFHFVSFTSFSVMLFGSVLTYPALALIPIMAVIVAYRFNHLLLVDNLYVENFSGDKKEKNFKENFSFVHGFGFIGSLISLDIKLMLRNKRSRISLWMPFLFLFYGLFFYPGGDYNRVDVVTDFMQMFIGMFISGFFIMSYGMMTFCYESNHFGFIQTRKIDIFTYLKARYYFMLMMATLIYVLSLFYLYFGLRVFIINSMMYLFNIGFTAFFFLFLSTFNKIRFDLSADMFSLQGKGSNQFTAIFALLILLLIVFIPMRLLFNRDAALYVVGAIGVLGFISHNQILQLLLKQFYRRKYIMSEGFRQS